MEYDANKLRKYKTFTKTQVVCDNFLLKQYNSLSVWAI